MRAIRVHEFGGPEAMRLEEVPTPKPADGQALVRIEAAGVNFIDIYQRTGLYQRPLPYTPGSEGAGTVIAVGADVSAFKVGDKVASESLRGAYAELAPGITCFITGQPSMLRPDALAGLPLLQLEFSWREPGRSLLEPDTA